MNENCSGLGVTAVKKCVFSEVLAVYTEAYSYQSILRLNNILIKY